jgi:hypothetical protein
MTKTEAREIKSAWITSPSPLVVQIVYTSGAKVREGMPTMIVAGPHTIVATCDYELQHNGMFVRGTGGFLNDADAVIALIKGQQ